MRISWLLRNWFGTSDTVDGQGLETTFEHTWPLPAWLTVLAVALVAAIVLATYHHERRGRKPIRAVMTALRLATFALEIDVNALVLSPIVLLVAGVFHCVLVEVEPVAELA